METFKQYFFTSFFSRVVDLSEDEEYGNLFSTILEISSCKTIVQRLEFVCTFLSCGILETMKKALGFILVNQKCKQFEETFLSVPLFEMQYSFDNGFEKKGV